MRFYAVSSHVSRSLFNTQLSLVWACLLFFSAPQPAGAATKTPSVAPALSSLLASGQIPLLHDADFTAQSHDVQQLYRLNGNRLLWLGEGRPEANREDALSILGNASADGLNPKNYDAERLRQLFQEAASLPQNNLQTLVPYDVALSVSLLRYMHDVHSGQVNPQTFNYPQKFAPKQIAGAASLLKQHIDQQGITDLPQAIAPRNKQYALLKQFLAEFRQQLSETPPEKIVFGKTLHPGEEDPQLPLLRQRLHDIRELTLEEIASVGDDTAHYDEATAAAIIRLQKQQGLQADGVIGRQTLTLLNMTPAEKIALIELAMERLRWFPVQPAGPHILVNIPAFQLWALNSPDDENALNMKVVVGKAEDNQTPILLEEMRYLEFMPYWNIPKRILDKEILPKAQAGRNYLSDQNIQLVERDSRASDDFEDPQGLADNTKHGKIIGARQLPGKKNPLGKVKFIFPNKDDVYLHDTPFHSAFSRDRRDLSHGCVRVSEAEKLAEFVLGEQQGWDRTTIEQAMTSDKTQRVGLKRTIPVLFFYSTAYAGQDKKLRFYPDIYGYDAQLKGAISSKFASKPQGKNAVDS